MTEAVIFISVWLVIPVVAAVFLAARNKRRDPYARFGPIRLFLALFMPFLFATWAMLYVGASLLNPTAFRMGPVSILLMGFGWLGVAGLTLIIPWAVVGKVHGRSCRKCHYDMTDASMKCPECGYVGMNERQMYTPIRRKKTFVVSVGLLVLIVGGGVFSLIRSGDLNVGQRTPTAVIAVVAPHQPDGSWWRQELIERLLMQIEDPAEGATAWAVHRAARMHLREDGDWYFAMQLCGLMRTREEELIERAMNVLESASGTERAQIVRQIWPEAVDPNWEVMTRFLDDDDPMVRNAALGSLLITAAPDRLGGAVDHPFPMRLLDLIEDTDAGVARGAVQALGLWADRQPEAGRRLWELLDHPDRRMSTLAIYVLFRAQPDRVRAEMQRAFEDPNHDHHQLYGAVAPACRIVSPEACRAFVAAMDAPEHADSKQFVVNFIYEVIHNAEDDASVEIVQVLLQSTDESILQRAILALPVLDPDVALPMLDELQARDDLSEDVHDAIALAYDELAEEPDAGTD